MPLIEVLELEKADCSALKPGVFPNRQNAIKKIHSYYIHTYLIEINVPPAKPAVLISRPNFSLRISSTARFYVGQKKTSIGGFRGSQAVKRLVGVI